MAHNSAVHRSFETAPKGNGRDRPVSAEQRQATTDSNGAVLVWFRCDSGGLAVAHPLSSMECPIPLAASRSLSRARPARLRDQAFCAELQRTCRLHSRADSRRNRARCAGANAVSHRHTIAQYKFRFLGLALAIERKRESIKAFWVRLPTRGVEEICMTVDVCVKMYVPRATCWQRRAPIELPPQLQPTVAVQASTQTGFRSKCASPVGWALVQPPPRRPSHPQKYRPMPTNLLPRSRDRLSPA